MLDGTAEDGLEDGIELEGEEDGYLLGSTDGVGDGSLVGVTVG